MVLNAWPSTLEVNSPLMNSPYDSRSETMARDSGAGAYSNLGISVQGRMARGAGHDHDPSWPGTFGGQRSSKRYSGQQDAPEPGSGEVDVRDDLEHEESDRPQRAAQARDQADRECIGHDDADHRVGQDRGGPDHGADPPDVPEAGQPQPKLVP